MTSNRDILIQDLESQTLLSGRFRDIKCVNYDAANGKKNGHFSLVFRAFDILEDKHVALKFFDIDYAVLQDPYRIQAFEREPEILRTLLGKERCLQLTGELATYELEIRGLSGQIVMKLPCKFFAVDWIEQEIDDYFFNQHQNEASEKLRLFNEIVLAVEALHRHEVHHRDLKPDNLRSYVDAIKRVVVAIDLGAAARMSSTALAPFYGAPVGAIQYASPESFCGLSGHRDVAHLCDIYALGCLLYELFNRDLFISEAQKNPNRGLILAALAIDAASHPPEQRFSAWSRSFNRIGKAIGPVSLLGPGNSVPPAIRGILNQILASLTHFDPLRRASCWRAMKIDQLSGVLRVQN